MIVLHSQDALLGMLLDARGKLALSFLGKDAVGVTVNRYDQMPESDLKSLMDTYTTRARAILGLSSEGEET